jgi:hypothetical protein
MPAPPPSRACADDDDVGSLLGRDLTEGARRVADGNPTLGGFLDAMVARKVGEESLCRFPLGPHRDALVAVAERRDALDDVCEDETEPEPIAESDRLRHRVVVLRAVAHDAHDCSLHAFSFVRDHLQAREDHAARP